MLPLDTPWGIFCAILRVAGPAMFMGMQFSSLNTALNIARRQSTGKLSAIPFLSLLANSSVWATYGCTQADLSLVIPNMCGVIIGTICVTIFHTFTLQNLRNHYIVSFAIIFVSFAFGLLDDIESLSSIAIALSIILLGSPLAVLRTVIVEKSTNAMPFSTSVFTFFNALSWTLYGYLVSNDITVWGSSGVGLILAVVQLLLFAVYGLPDDASGQAAKERIPQTPSR
jgi:solute carrier family 50 protein (sugar transporter)